VIRITEVRVSDEARRNVMTVLDSGRLAQGPFVEQLEERFRSLTGATHAFAVFNGTIALAAALEASGLGPGDEVITTPFTFVATINVALQQGCRVRLADIDPVTMCIDPEAVGTLVTPATRAVLPVHLFGGMADLGAIEQQAPDVPIIEDACQAHGAKRDGRNAGGSHTGCFSLYATKNLMAGEGGMITTNDEALAGRLHLLRNQGMRTRYEYEVVGRNYRMTELQAAVGLGEFDHFDEFTERRRRNARILADELAGIDGLVIPNDIDGGRHVFHQFTIKVTEGAREDRDGLLKLLADDGVECGVYYPRTLRDYACYAEHPLVAADPTPVADRTAGEVLSLPVHQWLTEGDLAHVVQSVRKALA
jgi:perosamine synthetase